MLPCRPVDMEIYVSGFNSGMHLLLKSENRWTELMKQAVGAYGRAPTVYKMAAERHVGTHLDIQYNIQSADGNSCRNSPPSNAPALSGRREEFSLTRL